MQSTVLQEVSENRRALGDDYCNAHLTPRYRAGVLGYYSVYQIHKTTNIKEKKMNVISDLIARQNKKLPESLGVSQWSENHHKSRSSGKHTAAFMRFSISDALSAKILSKLESKGQCLNLTIDSTISQRIITININHHRSLIAATMPSS